MLLNGIISPHYDFQQIIQFFYFYREARMKCLTAHKGGKDAFTGGQWHRM